jgi:putative transposase
VQEPQGHEHPRPAAQAAPGRSATTAPGDLGAPTRGEAEHERDATVSWLQADAAATLLRDWDDLVTSYDFPAEHWRHLRTSNVVESDFSGVRLRTTVAKRARVRENALYLVFKIVERLADHCRTLNGGATIMTLLLAEARFRDEILVEHATKREEVPMAA